MNAPYEIHDLDRILSPGLVVFRPLLEHNLAAMLRIAGGPERLRPHCKTHKMPAIARLELSLGIGRHKCATLAEAEMLAQAGATDVLLAYPLVGPNLARAAALLRKYPDLQLACTADHPEPVAALGRILSASGRTMPVLLDLDTGQGRTGLPPGPEARALYETFAHTPGVVPGGLHLYDGQNHQSDLEERRAAVLAVWERARALRDQLQQAGLPVPRIVAGGTGSFPIFAALDDASLELSPGTTVLHDAGYARMFPDLPFLPAAGLVTRVISLRGPTRVTLDLGYKACASDPPAGQRLHFPECPDAREALQNEEHLVLETAAAARLRPGDALLAIPRHICPTTALHRFAYVVDDGRVVDHWEITARDRELTV